MASEITLLLLICLFSFAKSSELKYIKTEVYRSSWNPGVTLEKIRLTKECSQLCQMTSNCTAYHHDRCFKICELGQRNGLTSAVKAGNDTVTVFIQPDNWKLLVANHYGSIKTVEVINFRSNKSVCTQPPDFPVYVRGSVGGLVDKTTPMICGGIEQPNQCYKLESGAWQLAARMLQPRQHSAGMSFSPFHNTSHKFFILGGYVNVLSAEILTDSGWENTTTILPVGMYVACMVAIGNDTYFIHGGIHADTNYSPQTYFFAATQSTWTRGPDLAIGRYGNGCGSLPTNEKSAEISVIIAGGYSSAQRLNSVETLDISSKVWRPGPTLPQPIHGAPIVQHPNGGVIMIIYTSIYYLANAGSASQWQLLPQKLAVSRQWFLAFFVPDEVAACT